MAKNKSALPLEWEVFIRKRASATQGAPSRKADLKWVSNAVTLIYGDSDAVLVDTLLSDQQNRELADWIEARHKTLRWIYVTATESFCHTAQRAGLGLSPAEVDGYYDEQRTVATMVGLDRSDVPAGPGPLGRASRTSGIGRRGPARTGCRAQ